jgi:hypothetical protein
MRRTEIKPALMAAIRKNFPDDVAAVFREDDLEGCAQEIQNLDKDNDRDINDLIREIAGDTPGKTLDALADGEGDAPEIWLYNQLR